jgi:hypothetical protein
MHGVWFEPMIQSSERAKTVHALYLSATVTSYRISAGTNLQYNILASARTYLLSWHYRSFTVTDNYMKPMYYTMTFNGTGHCQRLPAL